MNQKKPNKPKVIKVEHLNDDLGIVQFHVKHKGKEIIDRIKVTSMMNIIENNKKHKNIDVYQAVYKYLNE